MLGDGTASVDVAFCVSGSVDGTDEEATLVATVEDKVNAVVARNVDAAVAVLDRLPLADCVFTFPLQEYESISGENPCRVGIFSIPIRYLLRYERFDDRQIKIIVAPAAGADVRETVRCEHVSETVERCWVSFVFGTY